MPLDGSAPIHPTLPFTPRLAPLAHQAGFIGHHTADPGYALFWEQGTGKTKALIDEAVALFMAGAIDGVFLLAPNGVHYNWFVEELPKHWPLDAPPYRAFFWHGTRAGGRRYKEEFEAFNGDSPQHANTLPWLCMSYDSVVTDFGKQASWAFMRQRRVLYIADESQRIKSPTMRGKNKVERTTVVTKSGQFAAVRRIASGTPMDTPLDIYSQVRFLDPDFWARELGLANFSAFRAHFALVTNIPMTLSNGRQISRPEIRGYQRMDELAAALAKISSRVLKAEVLDLPAKTYKRHYHELSNSQRAAYEGLRNEALHFLDSGELVTTTMALTLQLRLAQICSGHVTPQAGAVPVPFSPNPRTALLAELYRDLTAPVITWVHFAHDATEAATAARVAGRSAVVFDGTRPGASLEPWHAGKADTIIANMASGLAEGHTLNEAPDTVYYSRNRKLIPRLQTEDRNHRIGQVNRVTYHDLLAYRTFETRHLDALASKRDPVGAALGDDPRHAMAWLLEDAQ